MTARAGTVGLVLFAALGVDGVATAFDYGQCQDRARDRLVRGQVDPAIGPDRALNAYMADFHECQRLDAAAKARDTRDDQQRVDQQRFDQQRRDHQIDQQRADQQRLDQQIDQQRADQQRLDQQRSDQQRLDRQRARQRDDMLRNQR